MTQTVYLNGKFLPIEQAFVPVLDRGQLQGVLVVQTIEPRQFSPEDVRLLVMAADRKSVV